MSDRVQLEQGEARVLYATWKHTRQQALTPKRIALLNKLYGYGAADRIKEYMREMREGNLT